MYLYHFIIVYNFIIKKINPMAILECNFSV